MKETSADNHANQLTLQAIAHMHSHYPQKFGIPRQSGLVHLESSIVFEPAFREAQALRGIEEYDYLWLIWGFSENLEAGWHPTVRPPVLGGNERKGVFATRSPFRPNPLGLSCVRLLRVEGTDQGPVLVVEGADLMDGTPVYDIKPYLPQAESHPQARGGFGADYWGKALPVDFPPVELEKIAPDLREAAVEMLAQNPVPRYQKDKERLYGVAFDRWNIRFQIENGRIMVQDVELR